MGKMKKALSVLLVVCIMITLMPTQTFGATARKISKCTVTLSKTRYNYTGSACKPSVVVKYNRTTLKNRRDYTVTYTNNVNPGTASVKITGKGNYTGSVTKTFKIKNTLSVTLSKTSYTYSGNANKPTVTVKSGTTKLASKYYTVTYKNNTKAGTAEVIVKGKGKYKGKNARVTFKIAAKSIAKAKVTLSKSSYTYSGSANKPTVTVKDRTKTLKNGTDYTVSYRNNVNAGTATVTVTGKGNYSGRIKKTFKIERISISDATVSMESDKVTYTGSKIYPNITVTLNGNKLMKDTDYELSGNNNINVGGYNVAEFKVVGKGNYQGETRYYKYTIEQADSNLKASLPKESVKLGEKTTINVESDAKVAFVSDNESIATVDEKGEVSAVGMGTVQLRVVVNDDNYVMKEIFLNIKVVTNAVPTLSTDEIDVTINGERVVVPLINKEQYDVTYESLDTGIATVTSAGEVQGISAGTTQIKVTANGEVLYLTVIVKHPEYTLSVGEARGYIGDAKGISLGDHLRNSEKEITWESSNPNVATVCEYPKNLITGVDRGDMLIDFVGAGEAKITATDGEIVESCIITVKAVDDGYLYVVKKNVNDEKRYDTISDLSTDVNNGVFENGQSAASVLGAPAVEEAEGYNTNHPNGMAYYKDSETGTVYYVVSDVYNNRVLVYTGTSLANILERDWIEDSNNTPIVLGQKNGTENISGKERNQMNWPMSVAIDESKGTLYVADTRNHRILVFDDITSVSTGCMADHSIEWYKSDHTTHNNHIQWPWSVSCEKEGSLIVTDTCGTNVLIWDNIPDVWEEKINGEYTENYYPNLVIGFGVGTTPRSICWTGNQLLIGDENISNIGASTRVFNEWPTREGFEEKYGKNASNISVTNQGKVEQTMVTPTDNGDMVEDFIYEGVVNLSYSDGVVAEGKLYLMVGNNIIVFNDGIIDSATEKPDLTIGSINARYSVETGYFFYSGGTNKLMYKENMLLASLHNANHIVGYTNLPTKFEDCPDIDFGYTKNYEIDVIDERSDYIVGTDCSTDGKSLILSTELNKKVQIFKDIPYSSGAPADYEVYFNWLTPGGSAIGLDNEGKNTTLMVYCRTHAKIYIWDNINDLYNGNVCNRILGNRIGSLFLTGTISDLDYDGKYTYITLNNEDGCKTYIFEGIPTKESEYIKVIENGGNVSTGAGYITVIPDANTKSVEVYSIDENLGTEEALKEKVATKIALNNGFINQIVVHKEPIYDITLGDGTPRKIYEIEEDGYTRIEWSDFHAMSTVIEEDLFAIVDLECYRVICYHTIQEALEGVEPYAILGHGEGTYTFRDLLGEGASITDQICISTKNNFAMPKTILYDGTSLFVGEFKFANRFLRFQKNSLK